MKKEEGRRKKEEGMCVIHTIENVFYSIV